MTERTDRHPATPRAALEAARVVFGPPDFAPAPVLWRTAQQILQQVLGRAELSGQALVAEMRGQGRITLSDANALVALSAWSDRATTAPTNEAERLIVREAWMALDHAVLAAPPVAAPTVAAPTVAAPPVAAPPVASPFAPPPRSAERSPYAPPPPAGTPGAARGTSRDWSPPLVSAAAPGPGGHSPGAGPPAAAADATAVAPATSSHRRRLLLGLFAILLAAFGAGGGLWWYAGRADRALGEGIDAYQRGARETARVALARAAQLAPDDARPLVYLGRIAREEGDLARARRFLTSAVRLAPGSAIAARELASLMLADGQPEIARRFYVRAIEIDPGDRTAQGFLGCALFRLRRFDEAQRWVARAGPGDWQACVPPMPPPMPGPGSPSPPPA